MSSIDSIGVVVNRNRHGLRAPRGGVMVGGRFYRGGCFVPAGTVFPAPEVPAPRWAPGEFGDSLDVAPERVLAAVAEFDRARAEASRRLVIQGQGYQVRPVPIHPEVGSVAFRLDKEGWKQSYHVHRDIHGEVRCTCPDYEFRRAGSGTLCKHGRRLVELGMIPSPAVSVLPPSTQRAGSSAPSATPHRRDPFDGPAAAPPRRYEPTPEERREAAAMFAEA